MPGLIDDVQDVFPASAGINRSTAAQQQYERGVPRVSGDKPRQRG